MGWIKNAAAWFGDRWPFVTDKQLYLRQVREMGLEQAEHLNRWTGRPERYRAAAEQKVAELAAQQMAELEAETGGDLPAYFTGPEAEDQQAEHGQETVDEPEEEWRPIYWDTRENGPGWNLPGHPDQYREPEPYDPEAHGDIPISEEPESAQSVNSNAYWAARAGGHARDEAEAIAARAEREWSQKQGDDRPVRDPERGGVDREGVTHTGPETLDITGQAIGQQDPARDPGRGAPQNQAEAGEAGSGEPAGPYVENSGRHGHINMDRTAVGPNAQVNIRGGEAEFGSATQPPTREPGRGLGPQIEPEAG